MAILLVFIDFDIDDPIQYILIALGITFFLLLFILIFFYNDRKVILRTLRKHPSKKISRIKENEYARITGKAQAIDEPLTSPIGKRKCVYYQIKIEEKRKNGDSDFWHTIINEERALDFVIESTNEKAIIKTQTDPGTKMVYIVKDIKHKSGTWDDAPVFLENYLKSHGRKSTNWLGLNKTIRYKEGVIEIDEKISVMGIGNWKESDHNFDRYSSKTLFLMGTKTNKLLITDDPATTRKN